MTVSREELLKDLHPDYPTPIPAVNQLYEDHADRMMRKYTLRPKKHDLNTADFGRVEAAIRYVLEKTPKTANPDGVRAMERTLDKVTRVNGTGDYSIQWPGGPTLRESRARHEAMAKKREPRK